MRLISNQWLVRLGAEQTVTEQGSLAAHLHDPRPQGDNRAGEDLRLEVGFGPYDDIRKTAALVDVGEASDVYNENMPSLTAAK